MKSHKGEFYIACYNHGEIKLSKKTGYILDDGKNQYGMCRGEDGLYRITDLETGALLDIPGPKNYSIAQTYIQLQRTVKKFGGWLDAQKRKRELREAARKIQEAYEADERWNAMSGIGAQDIPKHSQSDGEAVGEIT